jgi:glycosyltransferase involved in cell wall biosynthesis
VNDSIAVEMAKRYQITRPITLTNAIDPPAEFNINIAYNHLREKLNLHSSRKILLFQGGFSKHRNLENLIDAMKYVLNPDIDLVMMGFGDYEAVLKARAERLGLLNKRIYFLKAVPQSELLQHSASADMGIIPYPHVDLNSYYCTPNKLFEFIQAGLPILANDSPELRRFVQGERFGMVMPMHSSQQIARAIDKAFEELMTSSWKQQLCAHQQAFTWKEQSKIYVAAMQPLLNSNIAAISKKVHPIEESV